MQGLQPSMRAYSSACLPRPKAPLSPYPSPNLMMSTTSLQRSHTTCILLRGLQPRPCGPTLAKPPFRPLTQLSCDGGGAKPEGGRIQRTISGLDALLGGAAPEAGVVDTPAAPSPPAPVAAAAAADTASADAHSQPPPQSPSPAADEKPKTRISRTLSGLDSLLGIVEDLQETKAPQKGDKPVAAPAPPASDKLLGDRPKGGPEDSGTAAVPLGELTDQFRRIAEKARVIEREMRGDQEVESPPTTTNNSSTTTSSSATPTKSSGGKLLPAELDQEQLLKEFRALVTSEEGMLSKDQVKRLREAAFGPQVFWVTETTPIQEIDRTGLLVRGNLRDDRDKVFAHVCTKVEALFPGKYEVLMVDDVDYKSDTSGTDPSTSPARKSGGVDRGPPIAFQIVPASQAQPEQTDGAQQAAAVVLSLLFLGTCLQLGLASNISKLPKETLEWLADPANYNSDQIPPGLDTWDPSTYIASASPLINSLLGINVAHELGHRLSAGIKDVKLGPTFIVPSFQIGTFGAITPFRSLLKDRSTMWDVAAAGPLAGFLASLSLLVLGLMASDPSEVSKELLVPVPAVLLQGSFLLTAICKESLGNVAMQGSDVMLSPLAIAGWYGLVTTALNMLPVGCLDGGRMVQGAFGKSMLPFTSLMTYLSLGLGLGGYLALPFGLYVILCQRTAEKFVKDNVAPAGMGRQVATVIGIAAAILILIPMAPDLSDAWGPDDPFV